MLNTIFLLFLIMFLISIILWLMLELNRSDNMLRYGNNVDEYENILQWIKRIGAKGVAIRLWEYIKELIRL